MASEDLDRIDMGILHLFQNNARDITTEEIGENVGLSSSAVAARLRELEDQGVITGYEPVLDYEAAGFDHHILVRATAPVENRDTIVERAIEIPSVISIKELISDEGNMMIELVTPTQNGVEEAVEELNELDIEVLETEMLKAEFSQVFDHFGERYVTEPDE